VPVCQLYTHEVRSWSQARVVEEDAPLGSGLQLKLPPALHNNGSCGRVATETPGVQTVKL
jgi:hypothetical protein